jgi:hypothetical protein
MRNYPMPSRSGFVFAFTLSALALVAGCGEDAPVKKKIASRETLNKKTQEVRNLKPELAKGGTVSDNKLPESDYLTVATSAYKTEVAKIAIMSVQQAIGMYEALEGEKPKTYEEFMEKIIKKGQPDGMMLPMLPYYQEYGYDPDKKELVVIEYPEKKKEYEKQEGIR